ncbi:unnamed protein product [Protopolystoma xenopodis]|uniref:Xrn1 N-terminal domain-containing protein n=1 Tax=Protopolystoma xenopodis TaxID=117903 RepID=A0A448X9Q4_9PLAT|nr:unnamed protein product [Protopolystoma xenopodis]
MPSMGVPFLFKWLSNKYPKIIRCCAHLDAPKMVMNNTSENGLHFDNLYLDMNNIIHPCTHPSDRLPPIGETAQHTAIFTAIDGLVKLVKPRKLLYLAIDGVAPRAKISQQRSRRFLMVKETKLMRENSTDLEKFHQFANQSLAILQRRVSGPTNTGLTLSIEETISNSSSANFDFDSNCITPGTKFMSNLSDALKFHIQSRLEYDSLWKHLVVILSDASVPGEGEHKIMEYIRKEKQNRPNDLPIEAFPRF